MLHHLKLKMNQNDDKSKTTSFSNKDGTFPPPTISSASSSSSISSSGGTQILAMNTLPNIVQQESFIKSETENLTNTLNIQTSNVPPASVSIISLSSLTGNGTAKRKIEDQASLHQTQDSEPVPSVVRVVPSPIEHQPSKKPRTVSISSTPGHDSLTFLLARPEDNQYLNPLHCFVRKNIECFVATAKDISAPCPGRKVSVVPGQVGLRCIHCRDVYCRNRTKRAVCYPSTVSRVYHCVSDMKFDHFTNCKFLPKATREEFDQLKASCSSKKRGKKVGDGSFNTARYYNDSALKAGLINGPLKGIVTLSSPGNSTLAQVSLPQSGVSPITRKVNFDSPPKDSSPKVSPRQQNNPTYEIPFNAPNIFQPLVLPQAPYQLSPSQIFCERQNDDQTFKTRLLAAANDDNNLAPIHCFVRRNVEVFTATPEDVAAPAPGRKTRVTVGQIGIRCIHCAKLSPKDRVKRAVCYPPSIMSIYHSVSNMKFDHFGACHGLSRDLKLEFSRLRQTSVPKCGKKVNNKTTAQYYVESAIHDLKLVDTPSGIRPGNSNITTSFSDEKSLASALGFSFSNYSYNTSGNAIAEQDSRQSPTNGMSVLMMAATDPTMREAYEKRKSLTMSIHNTQSFLPI